MQIFTVKFDERYLLGLIGDCLRMCKFRKGLVDLLDTSIDLGDYVEDFYTDIFCDVFIKNSTPEEANYIIGGHSSYEKKSTYDLEDRFHLTYFRIRDSYCNGEIDFRSAQKQIFDMVLSGTFPSKQEN